MSKVEQIEIRSREFHTAFLIVEAGFETEILRLKEIFDSNPNAYIASLVRAKMGKHHEILKLKIAGLEGSQSIASSQVSTIGIPEWLETLIEGMGGRDFLNRMLD
jgi:hypothetical protein